MRELLSRYFKVPWGSEIALYRHSFSEHYHMSTRYVHITRTGNWRRLTSLGVNMKFQFQKIHSFYMPGSREQFIKSRIKTNEHVFSGQPHVLWSNRFQDLHVGRTMACGTERGYIVLSGNKVVAEKLAFADTHEIRLPSRTPFRAASMTWIA